MLVQGVQSGSIRRFFPVVVVPGIVASVHSSKDALIWYIPASLVCAVDS